MTGVFALRHRYRGLRRGNFLGTRKTSPHEYLEWPSVDPSNFAAGDGGRAGRHGHPASRLDGAPARSRCESQVPRNGLDVARRHVPRFLVLGVKGRPPRLVRVFALVGVLGLLGAACSSQGPTPSRSFRLAVDPDAASVPDIRISFSADATIDQAEDVQTEISRQGLSTQSMLKAPFRTLDLKITAGDPTGALARVQTLLRRNPAVGAVEGCPCPEDRAGPDKVQVGVALFKLQRSCAASTRPVPLYGCVTELESIGPEPLEDCSPFYFMAFEARARQVADQRVRRLQGRLTTAAGYEKGGWAPGVGKTGLLTEDNHTVRGELRGHYFDTWAYKEDIDFSLGQLEINPFPPNPFAISTRPVPSTTSPLQLKGAVNICKLTEVPNAEDGRRWGRYEVVADVTRR